MKIPGDIAENIIDKVLQSERILIISHRNPDADTIGSNLALRLVFERIAKNVTSACVDPISLKTEKSPDFLPNIESYVQNFDYKEFDLIFTVDAGSISQTGFLEHEPAMLKHNKIINIDHHHSNNRYGTINLVISDAASTTLIIYHLLKSWNQKINPAIATCLLYGLYYDTGSFMHSNTNDKVYEVAANLMAMGAKHNHIVKNLFKNHSIEQLKLWGKVLSESRFTKNNVIVAGIQEKDFAECQGNSQDLSGVIDYLSMAKANNYAALLSEDKNGNIKGSLRTRRDDINVSKIAGHFGGGGHKKASGFSLHGYLSKETRWLIKPPDDKTKPKSQRNYTSAGGK